MAPSLLLIHAMKRADRASQKALYQLGLWWWRVIGHTMRMGWGGYWTTECCGRKERTYGEFAG